MKKLLLILLIGIGLKGHAQYFDYFYDPFQMGNGLVTKYTSDGHIMAGIINFSAYDLAVVRTNDVGGFSSSSNFNKSYHMIYQGNPVLVNSTKVIEFSDGSGYGVMASFSTSAPAYGILYLYLSTTGTVTNTGVCSTGTYQATLNATCESIMDSNGDVYGTGNLTGNRIFLVKFNQAGTLLYGSALLCPPSGWSPGGALPDAGQLNEMVANDIIQSPNIDQWGAYPVIIVGKIHDRDYSNGWDGMWLPAFDHIYGGAPYTVYDNTSPASNEAFQAINYSNDGFILAGDIQHNTTWLHNSWITLMDQANAPSVLWSFLYQSPFTTGGDPDPTYLTDIIERAGNNEYYAIGANLGGTYNGTTLVKVDNTGAVITGTNTGREYQWTTNLGYPVSIDLDIAGTSDGVALYGYGYSSIPNAVNMELIKAYFNGVIDCSSNAYTPTKQTPTINTYFHQGIALALEENSISVDDIHDNNYTPNCYAETVSGGSNTFTGIKQTQRDSKSTQIYPNPIKSGEDLNLNVFVQSNEIIKVNISDLVGRSLYSEEYTGVKGINKFKIVIDHNVIKTGIYQISIEHGNTNNTNKLIVN